MGAFLVVSKACDEKVEVVPMSEELKQSKMSTERLLKLATYASVATAFLLIITKVFAWGASGSVSVLASLIDSLMDIAASLINLVAVRYALAPADEEHRFGHGKAESLSGLAQAMFIAGSAVFLLFHSADRLMHPREIDQVNVALIVMAFSIFATALLLMFQRYVIKQTQSVAIKADSLHYAADLVTNISIIGALLLTQAGWPGSDPLFAIAIAFYILYNAWHIGSEAADDLLDKELPENIQRAVKHIALRNPNVFGVHELRTRQSGRTYIFQFHIELDEKLSLKESHAIADKVENEIIQAYPGCDVIIHQDPFVSDESCL